jgi:hypothetical protein
MYPRSRCPCSNRSLKPLTLTLVIGRVFTRVYRENWCTNSATTKQWSAINFFPSATLASLQILDIFPAGGSLSALRGFRLMRILKLVRRWKSIQRVVTVIAR